ncbi:LysR family transcriptional regulator [Brenneria izbisi]|uniref:LysR family transcriptional regulator n=1 Tax=Brenneria izbisi TaxID=2939450 RepID=A0AA41XWW9_9GAMM|nr:LysR family transcriptional regulator [Brenneria izbisi]MCV9878764.1 LysR family transcriptional regulator [Brenneria izbisi]MCV9882053.1 LysR family transcriptional regulator [Brenneria izbisi]
MAMHGEDYRFAALALPRSLDASLSDPHIMTRMMFFVNLVTTGSISSAAERMGISISSGSRWLSDLEKEIGCLLYRRNNKAMPLTDAGDYLYRNFCLIGDKVSQLKRELTYFSTQRRGTIRICCTPVYAEKYLIPVVANYLAGNQEVNFAVQVSAFGIQNWKDHDIIIGAVNAQSQQRDQELPLVKRNLIAEPFVTVAAPQYLLMNGTPLHPRELVHHRCLFASSLTGSNDWSYEINHERHFFKIPKSLEVCDSTLLHKAVISAAGIAYLPEYVVHRDITKGKLVPLFKDMKTSEWLLNLYYPARSQITECVSSFKHYLIEQHNTIFTK